MGEIADLLDLPIVQAPMAGGPSTPALAAAVSEAGGLGFLGAGYLTVERLVADIAATRALTERPFGVNLFVGGGAPADPAAVEAYATRLADDAERAGVSLGAPRFDDDAFAAKVDLLEAARVAVVSFTFGLPPAEAAARLRSAGSALWMTVTSPEEAREAMALEPDALIVQGVEAGGHRGVFVDDEHASELTLLSALQLVRAAVDVPLVAAGGLGTGAAVGAALVAGAAGGPGGPGDLRAQEGRDSAGR